MNTIEDRKISETFYAGKGFTTCPGDVFTIQATSNMISSSIAVRITNDGTMNDAAIHTDEWLTIANRIEAWKLLKQLNDMGGRSVMYQIDDREPIRYEDSMPYKHRFRN
jgi:hypothetical protein